MMAVLSPAPVDAGALLTAFSNGCDGDGAIASFSGRARGVSKDGAPIDALVLQTYRSVTIASIEAIAAAATARFALTRAHVTHRSGRILPGETIVFVAAAAPHRAAALDAVAYMMDRLKTEAVFWKYEETPHGKQWIEPTDADYTRAQEWNR